MALLEVENLGISFGGLRAVNEFHLHIEKGSLYGLIGPNGAGKTTIFNLLTGVYRPNEGIGSHAEIRSKGHGSAPLLSGDHIEGANIIIRLIGHGV